MKHLIYLALITTALFKLDSLPSAHPSVILSEIPTVKAKASYTKAELVGMAHMAAYFHQVDPKLFTAQIRQESGFNPKAKSRAGAVGIAQIMPGTAKGWNVDPTDPLQSLNAAAKNMARYVRTYKAQGHDERTAYKLALAAYNAGPGAVAKYGGIPPYAETNRYVAVITKGANHDTND